MPYQEHPVSNELKDSEKIWRYMSFPKFISILEFNSLFFSRVDKLGDDVFEGRFHNQRIKGNIVDMKVNGDVHNLNLDDPPGLVRNYREKLEPVEEETIRTGSEKQRQCTFVNCWYCGDHESYSQWNSYGEKGVAIQSTIGNLKESFKNTNEKIKIFRVKYIDYNKDNIDPIYSFYPSIHKRIQFESEKELRALIDFDPSHENLEKYKEIFGIHITVHLDKLIENIYLYPTCQSWFFTLIEKILKRYNLDKKVKNSELSRMPI